MRPISSIVLFLVFTNAYSISYPDSLKHALASVADDSIKVILLNELAKFNEKYDYFECLGYANEAIGISQQKGFIWGEAEALYHIGTTHWLHSDYSRSRENLILSKRFYKELNDLKGIALCYNTLGLGYYYQAEYERGISHLDSALQLFRQLQDTSNMARVNNNLGLLYESKGEFDKATEHIITGLRLELSFASLRDQYSATVKEENELYRNKSIVEHLLPEKRELVRNGILTGDDYLVARGYSEIGQLYQMMGEVDSAIYCFNKSAGLYKSLDERGYLAIVFLDLARNHHGAGNADSLVWYYQSALKLLMEERMFPSLDYVYMELGNIYLSENRYQHAVDLFGKGLEMADSLGHRLSMVIYYRSLVESYMKLKEYDEALEMAKSLMNLSSEIGSLTHMTYGAEKLSVVYNEMGDFRNAIKYLRMFQEYKQRHEDAKTERTRQEFQARFELQQKAQQIELLSSENRIQEAKIAVRDWILVFSILGIVTILGFALVLRNRISRIKDLNQKVQQRSDENELLLKEIHHRVKNNLQVISSLINMQKRRADKLQSKEMLAETRDRVKSIGLIHEHLYTHDRLSKIDLKAYVTDLTRMLTNSLFSEKNIEFDLDVGDYKVDIERSLSIGLVLNELITNSLKYAFVNHLSPKLTICITDANDVLQIIVKDNGPGAPDILNGFGWTIIRATAASHKWEIKTRNDGGFEVSILLTDHKTETEMRQLVL